MDPAKVLDLAALARQKPMNDVIGRGDSTIQQFYCGSTVFVTGGSGFIGKQLIEKLFRSCALKKMYLLLRPKKGKTIQERLEYVLKDTAFETIRTQQPQFADKIIPVEGDVADIRLGLTDKDWNMLAKEVNIIFHVAATVRFDEPLRVATFTNLRGTREVLTLAKDCKVIKQMVHVSTAFSFATMDRTDKEVLESFYPCAVPPHTMITLAEKVDERRLDNITGNLIKGWPNTYTFTKAIAEELIKNDAANVPVCIVRPAIVLPAYIEPAPGWIDLSNVMGPSGILLASGLGFVHVFLADPKTKLDIVPVDFTNNAIITAAWYSTERRKNGCVDIPVYTLSKKIRFGFVNEVVTKHKEKLATPKAVWRAALIETGNDYVYTLLLWFLHYIPAYFLDFVCAVTGRKPKEITSFVDVYRKIDKLAKIYHYFVQYKWYFKNDNTEAMFDKMTATDQAIFNFDLRSFDFENYIPIWAIGLRKYVVRDGLQGTAEGYRKQTIYFFINYLAMSLYIYVLWFLISTVYAFLKNVLWSVY